jgi:glycosyltransferase involved in cell wall biosynthesis
MTPKVTVLLAVHDGEPYVRRCVESVLDQTFADFEFLVVDDASTDGTVATIDSFGDPRIRLLRNDSNLGQVPSLNRGLAEARGEYVARIDADDWCRPERLERQVAVLDGEPAVGVVGTWMDIVDERDRPVDSLRSRIADFVEFVYHTLIMRVYISHPSAMFRREVVTELGGYDESTGPAEDKDLWRRLALARWDARIVPEPLVVYRSHEGQLSQTRAAYQRDVDGRSQDRFLTALTGSGDVRPARLLLADDRGFWEERHDAAGALAVLERVLAGARAELRLDDAEAGRLERLVAQRLLAVSESRPWRREARVLAAYWSARVAGGRGPGRAARIALAPLREGTRRGTRAAGDAAARVPALRRLRASARRLPLARRLYGKLLGES